MLKAEEIAEIKSIVIEGFDEGMKTRLAPVMGEIAAEKAKAAVEGLRIQRALYGKDITGLSAKAKKDFAEVARAVGFKKLDIDTKANEALIEEQDNRGGYLVSREIAAAIMRIAASVGTIMNQSMHWTMTTDNLAVPNYTGSYLTGAYLNVDAAGAVTGLSFGQAQLIINKWQLAFAVGNDLLEDASVELADWLLAIAGESLANMTDQMGFVGTGNPFVGVLSRTDTTLYQLGSTLTSFDKFRIMEDSSAMIGGQEESILDGSAFYMHRTVWANLRVQKDGNGNYILPFAGLAAGQPTLEMDPLGGPIRPAGYILGYPVFTNRWLPTLAQTAVSKKFMIFGNMKALAYGDRGEMEVQKFESGSFGGKEIALADQSGIVYRHRHALQVVLPAAFQVAETAAS